MFCKLLEEMPSNCTDLAMGAASVLNGAAANKIAELQVDSPVVRGDKGRLCKPRYGVT